MKKSTSISPIETTPQLRYFPELLSDELLYSGMCRYCHDVHNGVRTKATMSLLGVEMRWFSPFFPPLVDELCKRMGYHRWNVESLLLDHTPLSAYYAFLSQDRRNDLLMTSADTASTIRKLGTTICQLHSQKPLQFCPQCLIDDTRQYGFPYWHCSHNLPGVRVCSVHGITLLHDCPDCREPIGNTNRYFLRPLFTSCSLGHPIFAYSHEVSHHKHHDILKSFSIEASVMARNARIIAQKGYPAYVPRLRELGYTTIDGRIRHKNFCEAFKQAFPRDLIAEVGISSSSRFEYLWLNEITNFPYKRTNPVMHMMVILFLFGSTEALINYKQAIPAELPQNQSDYTNTALFRCRNVLCPKYLVQVIEGFHTIKSRVTARTKAQYRCALCGYTYYRYIEHATSDDAPILAHREFGHLWHQILVDSYHQHGGDYKKICRDLHIASIQQVDIHLKQLGIVPMKTLSESVRGKGHRIPRAVTRSMHIEKITRTIQSHPEWSRSMLRKECNTAMAWLSKHEKDTYNALLPPSQPPTRRRDTAKKIADDKLFLSMIMTAYEEERNRQPPVRITMSLLCKHIPKTLSSYTEAEKYPMTKTFISKHVETKSEYHLRKFKYTIKELMENGDYPFITRVIEKSGINWPSAIKCKTEILAMIDAERRVIQEQSDKLTY